MTESFEVVKTVSEINGLKNSEADEDIFLGLMSSNPASKEIDNNRLQFFSNLNITSVDQSEKIISSVVEEYNESKANRLEGRLVVSNNLKQSVQSILNNYNLRTDAKVDLDGKWEDTSILRIGRNDGSREIEGGVDQLFETQDYHPKEIFQSEKTSLESQIEELEILDEKSCHLLPDAEKYIPLEENYVITLNPDLSTERKKEVSDLFNKFEDYQFRANEETIDEWLNGIMAVGFNKGEEMESTEIVSILKGNTAEIPIYDPYMECRRVLKIGDMEKALTLEDHRENGLYTTAGSVMLDYLLRSENVDWAYGESRAASKGVLHGSNTMGRNYYGLAPRKCKIGGPGTNIDPDTDYDTLAISGITAEEYNLNVSNS